MSKKWPTVCIDFDGVIHSYISGWNGAHVIPDPPVEGALLAIEEYIAANLDVQIFSSRSSRPEAVSAMRKWLSEWALIHFDHNLVEVQRFLSEISFPEIKPPAMVYIDDRGFHFKGSFPTVEFIKTFKPWNK